MSSYLQINNSHVICIICESAVSLVELEAFTNNNYTVNKVIAAVEKKREKDKSFNMLGPIKLEMDIYVKDEGFAIMKIKLDIYQIMYIKP